MTVAKWELWSLANMLISTHGDEAEFVAADRLETALAKDDSGEILVWREVVKKIPEIRAEIAGKTA